MNISHFSKRLCDIITGELNYSEEKKEIVAYGIETAFLTILGFLSIVLIAFFLNALVPATLAAIFGGLLRRISGGAHFETPTKCLVFGAISYSLLGVISKEVMEIELYSAYLILFPLLISLIIVFLYAPVDCDAKPIYSNKLKTKLKMASTGFVLLTIILIQFSNNQLFNISVVLGVGFQALTLLPVFNKKEREGKS